ncbi:MAG: polysaccharide biosynthesis tyrosine autokinase [Gloeocapsa sp. UFS-A4-WI-NPMV-4B04]|nr:polysaccharide biosynthesis tyrosine autokinase [Gloeocapsa sp. UFS-A4-WI-NPMV-4B04]
MESTESSLGFQQYWLILKRRWLPGSVVFASVLALTVLSLLLQKPIYLAEGKLRFQKTSATPSLTGLGKEIGQLNPLQEQGSPLETEAETIRSVPITQKLITILDLKDKQDNPLKIKQFLAQLTVSPIENTDILQISYKDNDPEKAATVVNTLMAVYLMNNQRDNQAEAVAAREFIEEQLPKSEITVRRAELALRRFKEANKVVSLDEEAKSAVAVIQDLERQTNTTQTGLADAKAQSALLKNELGRDLQEASTVTSVSQSPAVQETLKQIQLVDSQLAQDRSRLQENHPAIASLKSKKADLQGLLQEQMKQVLGTKRLNPNRISQNSQFEQTLTADFVKSEARRLGLESQAAALSNLQNTYKQRVNILPSLEQKQRELERQLQASQSTYAILLQKFQELRIAENQNTATARIISSALVPDEPIAPRESLYLGAGAILGLLLGVATAFILEAKDTSIRTIDEAKRMFRFPLLGIIPSLKKLEKVTHGRDLERSTPEIFIKDSPRSLFSTAYRMLQANLKFLSANQKIKVVAITSSVPKEGKSTVSANLAVAMAELGRKVLLVDADMHRPLQHRIWNLPNQLGLSNLILGQAEFRTAVKEVMVNLDVLTAGVMPPNPMALLDSQPMASLIEIFSANYDFTIIDTPSLSVDADASILGKMVDGVLLVVRPGVVDSATAVLVKEFLEQSEQKVLGQVINGVIPKNEPYSYYYFSNNYNAEQNGASVKKSVVPSYRKLE